MAISCLSISSNFPATPPPQHPTPISLSKSGNLDEALHLLLESHKPPNPQSYAALLHACISRKSLRHGRTLYLHLLRSSDDKKKELLSSPTLTSKFITLFSACGHLDEARRAFRHGIENAGSAPESVYVAMAIGFSKNRHFREALVIYREMLSAGVEPGNFAFSVALKACACSLDASNGKAVHAQVVKAGEEKEPDQVVYNALLKFYTECGSFDEQRKVFDKMPDRNVATWNAVVSGLVKRDRLLEALETFRRMQREKNVGFSWIGLTTVLAACARLRALRNGKEVHGQIMHSAQCPDLPVMNSLLDMYAKCGEMECCKKVFYKMPIKDLTSWNTLINGYAINGLMDEAVTAFERMAGSEFKADEVTFVSLLSGFSHAGMANEGQILFNKMGSTYGVNPNLEHHACLVDMLGRAGKIEEALKVVKRMPMDPSGSIWGSLLNSCRIHGYVSLADIIAKILFEIEPGNPGNYLILSKIYANEGMWDKVDMVRELMEKKGLVQKG